MNRDTAVINIRPRLKLTTEQSTDAEKFQNITLRPILKLQNSLILESFKHRIVKHKSKFQNLSAAAKDQYIKDLLAKDIVFKNRMIGLTVGLFTEKELANFLVHEKEYTKRLTQMLVKRIQDQVDLVKL